MEPGTLNSRLQAKSMTPSLPKARKFQKQNPRSWHAVCGANLPVYFDDRIVAEQSPSRSLPPVASDETVARKRGRPGRKPKLPQSDIPTEAPQGPHSGVTAPLLVGEAQVSEG